MKYRKIFLSIIILLIKVNYQSQNLTGRNAWYLAC